MHQTVQRHRVTLLALVLAPVIALLAALPGGLASPAAAEGPDEFFDTAGASPGTGADDGYGVAALIENFSSDGQVVRWPAEANLVSFCTVETGRPAAVTADQFHEAIRLATEMWNGIDAAIGVRYVGVCDATQVTTGNLVNEIGWDDARNQVTGAQAGLTRGRWLTAYGATIGYFDETDIILDNNFSAPEACLRTLLAHEMGHAIGFGHSDTRSDLMWPSYNRNDLSTCRPTASASEAVWLINLYGSNQKPTMVTTPESRTVAPGGAVSMTAQATDPEGDALTFEWRQVSGPAITISATGATASFTAPAAGIVTIEVSAVDRLRNRATGTVVVTVQADGTSSLGGFRGTLEPSGVTLAQWGGGNISAGVATPGVRVRSVWVFQGGGMIGYIAGAPEFVNQTFFGRFPGGAIPEGTFLAVVTGD